MGLTIVFILIKKYLENCFNIRYDAAFVGEAGCLAQLVERRPYKANVSGSTPLAPTKKTSENDTNVTEHVCIKEW
jgi:hypothetical protein